MTIPQDRPTELVAIAAPHSLVNIFVPLRLLTYVSHHSLNIACFLERFPLPSCLVEARVKITCPHSRTNATSSPVQPSYVRLKQDMSSYLKAALDLEEDVDA